MFEHVHMHISYALQVNLNINIKETQLSPEVCEIHYYLGQGPPLTRLNFLLKCVRYIIILGKEPLLTRIKTFI